MIDVPRPLEPYIILLELLNMSYIPVNCFIVSTILFECFSDYTGILPPTLTELYRTVIEHFEKRHSGNLDGQSSAEALKKHQLLCWQLVFGNELFHRSTSNAILLYSSNHTRISRCKARADRGVQPGRNKGAYYLSYQLKW